MLHACCGCAELTSKPTHHPHCQRPEQSQTSTENTRRLRADLSLPSGQLNNKVFISSYQLHCMWWQTKSMWKREVSKESSSAPSCRQKKKISRCYLISHCQFKKTISLTPCKSGFPAFRKQTTADYKHCGTEAREGEAKEWSKLNGFMIHHLRQTRKINTSDC